MPSKVTQKVNSTHKKERKQQKGEVKGKRLFVKLKRAKGEMSQKQRKGAKGKKQYKKGKKTAVVLAKQKYAGFWQSKLK